MLDSIQITLQGLCVPVYLFLQGVDVSVLRCSVRVRGRVPFFQVKLYVQNQKVKIIYENLPCHWVSEMEQKWHPEILWYTASAPLELGHFLKSSERTEGSWKTLPPCTVAAGERVEGYEIFFAFSFSPSAWEKKKNIWELKGTGTVKQSTSTLHLRIKFQTASYIWKHLIDG